MPELPEVETIVRELRRAISDKKLRRVFVFDPKLKKPRLKLPSRVLSIYRKGKYIILDLDCGKHCVVHLRMTGQLAYGGGLAQLKRPRRPRRLPRERAALLFSDGSALRFFDARRFGTMHWQVRGDLPRLGAEPLSGEFNAKNFAKLTQNSRRPIKSFLLDQRKVAGIGNIYADEALWLAKIHPKREADSLGVGKVGELVRAIREVLREAIKKGGFTLRDYRRTDGSSGRYQHSRKAYDREGEKCLRCGTKIARIKLGGRSSYFCPKCQRK